MYYGIEILKIVGFFERMFLICNVLNGVFFVGGMVIGVLFLVDCFKWKILIIYGFVFMVILYLIIVGVDYYLMGEIKVMVIWLFGVLFVGVM